MGLSTSIYCAVYHMLSLSPKVIFARIWFWSEEKQEVGALRSANQPELRTNINVWRDSRDVNNAGFFKIV